ncbi:MAG: radical SAM protein [archaeon]|nr:radical SAM protein [archaeon]MCP8318131.1 radical SAM protein [archaeon]MCP8319514.1 radical SAM protein [archaeon]
MSLLELERLKEYSFELAESWIRPTSEILSHSLLLRLMRNCPWNLCKFCECYKGKKFEYRSVKEIKEDIDAVKAISDEINVLAKKLGGMDWVAKVINSYFLYDKNSNELEQNELQNLYNVAIVFNWLCFGASTVFFQDSDSLIMHTSDLVEVIKYLKQKFPSIERITSYARAKTIVEKNLEELIEICKAGLSRLHIGLESGDDEVLRYINKGVNSEECILAGKKAMKAGFELSEYVMPGMGGRDKSEKHAKNTARVLNEINPDFIMMRPFVPRKGTPLFEEYEKGNFQLTSPHERLREIKIFIEDLKVKSRVCFDQPVMNSWHRDSSRRYPLFRPDSNGYKFPEEKDEVLKTIELGLAIDESVHIHAKDLINQRF